MSQVFISYKREDQSRVDLLVKALEDAGLSVWWDRSLACGESWRNQIQNALNAATCVIVVWTHASVGPAADFVWDEAEQARRRGVLIPVKLDEVDPPVGFGEIQAVDLTRWNGHTRDAFFQALVDAVTTKREGRAGPTAKEPMKRLLRRVTYGGLAGVLVPCSGAFGSNMWRLQERLCGMSLLQPHVSDACGALGFGDRPVRKERIAWEKREPGSCAALRVHIERFSEGVYRAKATSLLTARHLTQAEVWVRVTHSLDLFQSQEHSASSSEAKAKSLALVSAQAGAKHLCSGFAATASFRLISAAPKVQKWTCDSGVEGTVCGFEGEAICELDQRRVVENETCAK